MFDWTASEWGLRQLCFFIFVMLTGTLLHANDAAPWAGLLSAADDSIRERCKRFSVPVLLYAASELLCYGRGAAVLLPIRMLSLLYGCCLYKGLLAAVRLIQSKRWRRFAEKIVFPLVTGEAALLGFVLLRDGYCRNDRAPLLGLLGLFAAIALHLLTYCRRVGHGFRSAR